MNDIVIKNGNDIVTYKHTNHDLPKPFMNNIFLIHTHIAGTAYVYDEDIFNELNNEDRLYLYRETDNIHDERAILVSTNDNHKLGYIPRYDNKILSRLMDAGKSLYAIISDISMDYNSDSRRYVDIDIYMED